MARLVGITDLRQNARGIIDSLDTDGPVTVLRNNAPVAILVPPSEIERLADRIEELEIALAIAEDDGERIPHAEVMAEMADQTAAV